jgi:hypothetical protein
MKKLQNELKKARQAVNALTFGTKEWEEAMQVVRSLTNEINNKTSFGEYKSIDGDIFSL